jgi:hypothetical protein
MRNPFRGAHRPRYRASQHWNARTALHPVARLWPDMLFWWRPPNPARLLCVLVRRILKFHESEPLFEAGKDRRNEMPLSPDSAPRNTFSV